MQISSKDLYVPKYSGSAIRSCVTRLLLELNPVNNIYIFLNIPKLLDAVPYMAHRLCLDCVVSHIIRTVISI